MTGVVVVVLVSALCAAAVLCLLVLGHRPEEGWHRWMRGSVDAWRADELQAQRLRLLEAEERDIDVFSLGETVAGTGYAHPDEIRARLNRPRTPVRH